MKLALCLMIALCSLFIDPSLTTIASTSSLTLLTGLLDHPSLTLLNFAENFVTALRTLQPILTDGYRNYCKAQNCVKPNFTVPITEYLGTSLLSPLFVSVLPENNHTKDIDNVCYTFTPANNVTGLISCISVVFTNGTNRQYCYLDADGPGLGVLRGANPSCTFQLFVISVVCEDCFIVYRCYINGECQQFGAGRDPGFDVVFGVCSSLYQSDACKSETIIAIQSLPEFKTRPNFVKLPQKLPYQCVTCFPNNGTAVNMGQFSGYGTSCQSQSSTTTGTSNNTSLVGQLFSFLNAYQEVNN